MKGGPIGWAALLLAGCVLAGCGGSDAGDGRSGGDDLPLPEWVSIRGSAVTIDLVAGQTDTNFGWNYNGLANGETTIVVPAGATVTIAFSNQDPANRHSVGVLEPLDEFPMTFDGVEPAFAGATTSNATSMDGATARGQSESITFTVGDGGRYALVCMLPAHAATGMWLGFEVSDAGELGIRD